MKQMPNIMKLDQGGCIWKHRFETFEAKVYVPVNELQDTVLNYGFIAPFLLVFEETAMSEQEAVTYAKNTGLEKLAANFASSVVFVYPTSANGWEDASKDLLSEIYSNAKIHQYYKDGAVIAKNRFTHVIEDYYIRGAIFRTTLWGSGASADYIAQNCIRHFEGDGLWGKADCAPVLCVLANTSKLPKIECQDIPMVSVGNSEKIDTYISQHVDHFYQAKKEESYDVIYENFGKQFRRMVGTLEIDIDLIKEGMCIDPGVVTVNTSKDNRGDDQGTSTHPVGYFAFYNKEALLKGKVPLLLCFHGGGDSAFFISFLSGWARVCHRHDFLLVSIENHLNSTATEMQELLEHLKKLYPIDETRIYASGFSMGGCKTWDLIQEYPDVLAAAAPMDATFDVGLNVYGEKAPVAINDTVPVPIFYAGGEITPLPELPFQEKKCFDRMAYVLRLNHVKKAYDISFDKQEEWEDSIWGISGDETVTFHDDSRNADLIIQKFESENGVVLSEFACITGQGHECREHTCEHAWQFMSQFRRGEDGSVMG